MGNWGFSYIGLIYLLMLWIPNSVWAKHQPAGYQAQTEAKSLVLLERIGQVCTTAAVLMFQDFNIKPWSLWSLWFVASLLCMILYEGWWLRYFRSAKTLADFYSSYLGVPVAGATLPVLAFFLLGIYGKVIWLLLATILLGIGHIGIHLNHKKEMLHQS